jgi:hypothetical protein
VSRLSVVSRSARSSAAPARAGRLALGNVEA